MKLSLGFISMLTLIFVVAKLWGKTEMSWFWVFSPIIFSVLAVIIFGIIFVIWLLSKEVFR
jgi:hypothetical protein